jgi:hypothetical protein
MHFRKHIGYQRLDTLAHLHPIVLDIHENGIRRFGALIPKAAPLATSPAPTGRIPTKASACQRVEQAFR